MASKLNDREIEIGAHPQCTQSHRADNIGRYVPENNDCLSFSKTAIFSSAVREDIHDLIHSYNEVDFFEIYLSPDESLTTQAAAVYALYLMYFTQPTRFSKIPIRLTTNSWNLLESVYKKAFENKAGDLIYVIRKLRSSNAFVYVAQEEPISKPLMGANEYIADQTEKSLLKIENTLHDNVLVPIEPLLSDMSSLAMEYKKAKAGLVSLALSRRSSEMVMEQLLLSKPANMNLNEAKPLPAFLSEESTLGTVSIPTRVFSNNTTTEEVTTIANATYINANYSSIISVTSIARIK
ncbi:hypothetical protein FBU30_008140 [Linnemannia zychae]|nr:hypothetical protein FBU30_008140 [Linnemannia zychae]